MLFFSGYLFVLMCHLEGGMIRLEALIELKFLNSSFSSRISRFELFELFELILLLKFNKRFPVERFEATVSRSAVPPLLRIGRSNI